MKMTRSLLVAAAFLVTSASSQIFGPPPVPVSLNPNIPAGTLPPTIPGLGDSNIPVTATPPVSGSIDSNVLASAAVIVQDWQAIPQHFNSTEWSRVQAAINPNTGQLEYRTNHYTELGNNLNFVNDLGFLEASASNISLMTNTGGAGAIRSPMKIYFPPSIGGKGDDPLTIVSPSNTVLKIKPLALFYYDSESGKSVLLASAQEAQGELVGVNQIIYKSIFPGCDIRMVYTRSAFESDLVMLARPRPPQAFGLSPDFTRLELWHAIDGPVPLQTPTVIDSVTDPTTRANMAEPDFVDNNLDFNDLNFPQGRAFLWSNLEEQADPFTPVPVHTPRGSGEVVVAKSWQQLGQIVRDFDRINCLLGGDLVIRGCNTYRVANAMGLQLFGKAGNGTHFETHPVRLSTGTYLMTGFEEFNYQLSLVTIGP